MHSHYIYNFSPIAENGYINKQTVWTLITPKNKGITVIKSFIWGGISSDIRRKFSFTATRERSRKTYFPNVYPTIYLPKLKF